MLLVTTWKNPLLPAGPPSGKNLSDAHVCQQPHVPGLKLLWQNARNRLLYLKK